MTAGQEMKSSGLTSLCLMNSRPRELPSKSISSKAILGTTSKPLDSYPYRSRFRGCDDHHTTFVTTYAELV